MQPLCLLKFFKGFFYKAVGYTYENSLLWNCFKLINGLSFAKFCSFHQENLYMPIVKCPGNFTEFLKSNRLEFKSLL